LASILDPVACETPSFGNGATYLKTNVLNADGGPNLIQFGLYNSEIYPEKGAP